MYERIWRNRKGDFSDLTLEPDDLIKAYEFTEADAKQSVLEIFRQILGQDKNPGHWTIVGQYPMLAILTTDLLTRDEIVEKLRDIGIKLRGGQN